MWAGKFAKYLRPQYPTAETSCKADTRERKVKSAKKKNEEERGNKEKKDANTDRNREDDNSADSSQRA